MGYVAVQRKPSGTASVLGGLRWCVYGNFVRQKSSLTWFFADCIIVDALNHKMTEFQVSEVVQREPITYGKDNKVLPSSGATYYRLGATKLITVKHTTSDTWVCLTCHKYYDGTERGKGCDHTDAAMKYAKAHDHIPES